MTWWMIALGIYVWAALSLMGMLIWRGIHDHTPKDSEGKPGDPRPFSPISDREGYW